ncbi:type III secretion system export apparatus subunit SctU [Sphingomonas sp. NCPPB 2930]
MSDEKTEKPTPKRLRDAKKKGQHAKSQDVTAAIVLGAMTACLSVAGSMTAERLIAVVSRLLEDIGGMHASTDLMPLLTPIVGDGLLCLLPFIFTAMLAGLAGSAVQVGLTVSMDPVSPKFDKLNPAQGLKKIFSMKSVIEFVKTLLKVAAMGAVLWKVVLDLMPTLMSSAYLPAASIAVAGWNAVLHLVFGGLLLFLVVGPLDFGLQKFQFLKDQRMTKDEVKREHKESEGDPQLKGKRKQIAREMATSAPKDTVPGASVVVTNPTHYAVALRYSPGDGPFDAPVPIVVAKGVDEEAAVIRRLAEEHGVPLMADPPLARMLYTLPLQEPIPEQMFETVAAILRWVAMVKAAGGGPAPCQRDGG